MSASNALPKAIREHESDSRALSSSIFRLCSASCTAASRSRPAAPAFQAFGRASSVSFCPRLPKRLDPDVRRFVNHFDQ
jgi:hypothetical protein